jgi:lipoate-protein ligase A
MRDADIKGVEGVVNMLQLSGAKNFAIYDVFKQNKLPLFKAEASTTNDLITKFREFSTSLQNKNYDIVIQNGDEKIKFTFSNQTTPETVPPGNLAEQIASIIDNKLSEIKKPSENTSLEFVEYKIENRFLKNENEQLKKELAEFENLVEQLQTENELLKHKLQSEDKILKYYELFNGKKETMKQETKPVLSDSEKEQIKNEKKQILIEITSFLNSNFSIDELKKLKELLSIKKDLLKSML